MFHVRISNIFCYYILTGLFGITYVLSNDVLVHFSLIKDHRFANSSIYETVLARTPEHCCMLCIKDKSCSAVSYNEATKDCFKSSTNGLLTKDPSWRSYEITKFSGPPNCLGRSCFTFTSLQQDWNSSKEYCAQKGAHLADLTTSEKVNFTENLAVLQALEWGYECDFYVSGNDFLGGDFHWLDGSPVPLPGSPDQYWSADQPDNGGVGNCLLVRKDKYGYSWNDVKCTDIHYALCEDD